MNQIKLALLLTGMTLILVFMGQAMGGQGGMMIALLFACGMNFFSYWYSDKIILKMHGAREITRQEDPAFHAMVERLAQRAQMPMPKLYIMETESPNAFATGRNPQNAAVAATRGILRMLSDEELEGVMAHELAHVLNRDTLVSTIVASIAGAISMLASMLQWSAIFGAGRSDGEEGSSPIASIVLAIVAPIAAMLVQMAVSRSREYMADETGARICGKPLALAGALQKLQQGVQIAPMQQAQTATAHLFIVNPLSGQKMAGLFSTHPPMEERIKRLRALAANS